MTITCTRKLHFCAGHRLVGHESKCSMLHGHQYNVEVTAEAYGDLDKVGRVIDFSVIKETYDPWIQENWDHGFLLNYSDTHARNALIEFSKGGVDQKVFFMLSNPTAENIAKFLGTEDYFVQVLAQHKVKVVKVVVHETDNCFATWVS